jgi:alpha-beta hydrolase superfamily lysophospholipase
MKKFYFSSNKPPKTLVKMIQVTTQLAATVAPKLVVRMASKILGNPYSQRTTNFDALKATDNLKVDTRGGQVHLYFFSGGDKHVLLTHGWGDTSRSFRVLIKNFLEQGYSVWCFDHIGHGLSEGNISHLFAFIHGLKNVISHIEEKGHDLTAVISHSMGGAAVLNLEAEFLAKRKIIIIATPTLFFEALFDRINHVGISKLVLNNLLESLAHRFDQPWQQLKPNNHKHKAKENMLFIHDEHDPQCSYENLVSFLEGSNAELITTQKMGHRKVFYDKDLAQKMNEFLADKL